VFDIIFLVMAGGMSVKKNVHIENWASYRENSEHFIKWNGRTLLKMGVFGVVVPVLLYRAIVFDLSTVEQGRGPEQFKRERSYWFGMRGAGGSHSAEKSDH